MTLKEIRTKYNLTQKEAAEAVNIPLRSYKRYENEKKYETSLKYLKIIDILDEKFSINESKGVLSIEYIKKTVQNILDGYGSRVSYCYLFGSYAKGYASEVSDVDLCIDTKLKGFDFVGLIEELHQALRKNVDLLRSDDLKNNFELLNEILKDGVKIYG